MEFGPKKGHVLYIFENFIKDFGLLILAGIIFLITRNPDFFTENIVVVVIVLVGPFTKVVEFLTTTYAIDSEKLIVKRGWLVKQNIEVPLSTITTVDISQNIIHQISGTYRLNADNASNVSGTETKIRMTFSKEDALLVKELLSKGKNSIDGLNLDSQGEEEKKETGDAYLVKCKDLLLMGAIKSKGMFFLQAWALATAGMTFITQMIDIPADGLMAILEGLFYRLGISVMALICMVILFVLAIVCGAVGSLIRYYDFHILDNGETLRIEYGLFTKKKFTIHKKKVSGFFYEQSLVMRWMKTGVLHIFAIGYGQSGDETSSEVPVLFPLLPEKLLMKVMGDILPEMTEADEYEKPTKVSLRYFFYRGGVVSAIITLAASIFLSLTYHVVGSLWILGGLCMLWSIATSVLQYRNTGIYGNQKHISFSFGGFKKTSIFVKSNNVESISESASFFKHKKGVTNISIGYIAPLIGAARDAKNLSLTAYENLKSKLIY